MFGEGQQVEVINQTDKAFIVVFNQVDIIRVYLLVHFILLLLILVILLTLFHPSHKDGQQQQYKLILLSFRSVNKISMLISIILVNLIKVFV